MPIISALSSVSGTTFPASTSVLPLNVGSTTMKAYVHQIIAGIFSTEGELIVAESSVASTALAPPTSGAVLLYSSVTDRPVWSIPTSGGILTASSVGIPSWLATGSSGQVLQTTGGRPTWVNSSLLLGSLPSTVGTSGQILQTTGAVASWVTPSNLTTIANPTSESVLVYDTTASVWAPLTIDPNELLRVSTAGALEVIAAPTSGAILRYSTANSSGPQWMILDSGEMLAGSSVLVAGTSGQILQTTGGIPAWRGLDFGTMFYGNSSNELTILSQGSSGFMLQTSGGIPVWRSLPSTGHITTLGSSGQFLMTTGDVASWAGLSSGEIFYGNSSGHSVRLAQGSSGQILQTTGGVPAWVDEVSTSFIIDFWTLTGANDAAVNSIRVIEFSAGVNDFIDNIINLPPGWSSNSTIGVDIYWTNTTNSSGNVQWIVEFRPFVVGSTLPAIAQDITIVGAASTVPRQVIKSTGSLQISSVTSTSPLGLRVVRFGTNSSDTLASTAHLLVLQFTLQ